MKSFFESKGFRELLRIVLAGSIGLALGFIITLFVSKDPVGAYKSFLLGPISRLNRIGDWLEESLTLILLGLVICIVFGASQWYIGVEGQMVLGAMAAGCVALYVPLPPFPRILLSFLAAMAVGALWGLIPALLKAYYSANELVTSLMMNTIALKVFEYVLKTFIMTPKSRSISSEFVEKPFRLPTFIPDWPFLQNIRELWMKQTSVTIMVYIVIAAVIVVYYLLYKTPFGYELRTVGLNTKFAHYGGINVKRTIIMSILVSGIVAGLAGAHLTLAIHNKIISNMTSGLGFEGINIAILAGNNPLGVPIAGLLYGYLRAGSDVMERSSDVSRELVFVIQAMVLLLVTAERLLPTIKKRVADIKEGNESNNDSKPELKNVKEGDSHVA